MKKIVAFCLFLFSSSLFSQAITVDDTSNTPAQLVDILLGNSCVEVSNITISSPQSVAYFNKNSSSFPISEGIIIRNGVASFTQGPYTGLNLDSQINTNNDTYLQQLSASNGQNLPITDVAFLEFDFVALSNFFNFNFLFASNEYGAEQCTFSDVFAFILTNLDTGVETNLAVIPGTNIPISVNTIRNSAFNQGSANCSSNNPAFFGSYNVGNPNSVINMRGNTIIMNASSNVVPNTNYKIRIVMGDYNDFRFDSAVFIQAGSFNTPFSLGNDRIICTGDEYELVTNLDSSFTFTWYKNDIAIAGETNPNYIVSSPGIYRVEAINGTCILTDTIVFESLEVKNPINLTTCNFNTPQHQFDLTFNNENYLEIDNTIYDLFYYNSLANITSNTPITNPSNYLTSNNETIYIKIFNTITNKFCDAEYSFQLEIEPLIIAGTPGITQVCTNSIGSNYNLSNYNSEVYGTYSDEDYSVTYHLTEADAISGINPVSFFVIPTPPATLTFYIRLYKNVNVGCYGVSSIVINVFEKPLVDTLDKVVKCSEYTLPPLTNGNYFTGPSGGGTPLFAGDIIDVDGTYYIFNGPDVNGCTNESTFEVVLIDEYDPERDYCGTFTVPIPLENIGDFYTAPGGPTGTGVLVPSGTPYINNGTTTITQVLYYYTEVDGVFCGDEEFVFYIHPIPLIDELPDTISCNTFTLPNLTNGLYYTYYNPSLNISGILQPGTVINYYSPYYDIITPNFQNTYGIVNVLNHTRSDNTIGQCAKNSSFALTLVDTSIHMDRFGCSNSGVLLPPVNNGGYYTQPLGQGEQLNQNIPITTSQTVYFFADTSNILSCNVTFNVTIHPSPEATIIPSNTYCGEYTLPTLTNGTYYKLSGGPNVLGQVEFIAGQKIDLTTVNLSPGTYYTYNETFFTNSNGSITHCTTEHPFTINILQNPIVDGVSNSFECLPYTISPAVNGTIYTAPNGPNGTGTAITTSTLYASTENFYIYNINPTTGCVVDVPFNRDFIGVNLPDYPNVNVCEIENYVLPTLTHLAPSPLNYSIGYFYEPNGINPIPPGTIFNTPNTTTTIYVYAINGDRIICTQEDSFDIIVSETPNLNLLGLVFDNEECGTYILPSLPSTTYNINYYSQPGGNAANLITNLNITTPGTYTYYVYASAIGNPNCNDEISFTFTVYPLLNNPIQGGIICVNTETGDVLSSITLNSGLNPTLFTVNWYLNGNLMGTGTNYTATQAGVYTVEFIKLTTDSGSNCNFNSTTVTVLQSSPALANFTVSTPFENNNYISINLTGGIGDYLYQLVYPNGNVSNLQSSNVFQNLESGTYYVNIYDTLGNCSLTIVGPIYIINYPRFFTPNGDGFNDTWNIYDLSIQPDAVISIFDRYGKLIKQFSPYSSGWDGTYNGEDLFATDYWFVVEYTPQNATEKQEFRAHFSLKR